MAGKNTIYIQDDVLKDLEQDTFGHKHIADAVVKSILTTKPPFTIGIFGGWGTGKSSLLEIIKTGLDKENITTVTIDAWRYSSADDLRRAFLVHVANQLNPKVVGELSRKLYTTEQETILLKSTASELTKRKWNDIFFSGLKTTFWLATNFFGISILFLFFLFLIFLIPAISQQGVKELWANYDWTGLAQRFLDLIFIPLLLALGNDLRLFVFQRPVTITQERIDADELFSYYFRKVISKVMESG